LLVVTPGLMTSGASAITVELAKKCEALAALKDFKRGGHVGLQDHGAVVKVRNIRIRPLASESRK